MQRRQRVRLARHPWACAVGGFSLLVTHGKISYRQLVALPENRSRCLLPNDRENCQHHNSLHHPSMCVLHIVSGPSLEVSCSVSCVAFPRTVGIQIFSSMSTPELSKTVAKSFVSVSSCCNCSFLQTRSCKNKSFGGARVCSAQCRIRGLERRVVAEVAEQPGNTPRSGLGRCSLDNPRQHCLRQELVHQVWLEHPRRFRGCRGPTKSRSSPL